MAHRRPNKPPQRDKLAEFREELSREEEQAADRVPKFDSRTRWPANDFVLGTALVLLGAIILIAIAIFTGLVKP